jgi:hypothetical protein
MKQNITLAVDKVLLKQARSLAAEKGSSVSALLAEELRRLVNRDAAYEQSKERAVARLRSPFHLGGEKRTAREDLHDRARLR